jgi:hypothetical protein
MGKDMANEGSIAAKLSHRHADWPTNGTVYKFDLSGREPILWRAEKNADRTLSVWVQGPFNSSYDFRVPMPPCADGQLHIGLSWANGALKLYLNGRLVKSS